MPFPNIIPQRSYAVSFSVAATAALDIVSLLAPWGKSLRLRRVVLVNPGTATAAAVVDWQLGIATAIGSSGAAATPQPLDAGVSSLLPLQGSTPAFDGTARTGDTTQATGFTATHNPLVSVSVPTTASGGVPQVVYEQTVDQLLEALTVRAGNVIVLRTASAGAGATGMRGYAEFTIEEP
jgi:hypothetical protein